MHPVVAGLPDYVEVMRRGDLVTVINQSSSGVAVELPGRDFLTDEPVGAVELPGFGVQLLRHPAR